MVDRLYTFLCFFFLVNQITVPYEVVSLTQLGQANGIDKDDEALSKEIKFNRTRQYNLYDFIFDVT